MNKINFINNFLINPLNSVLFLDLILYRKQHLDVLYEIYKSFVATKEHSIEQMRTLENVKDCNFIFKFNVVDIKKSEITELINTHINNFFINDLNFIIEEDNKQVIFY